jgi:tRNA1Val (adenine37-N6)-methyltransferase
MNMSSFATDTFFDGKIRVIQNRRGYRFSIDAVLLAYHANPRMGDKVLDLGTGCGIISIVLACRCNGLKIYAAEIQTELADLAAANVRLNRLEGHIEVLGMDMKLLTPQMTSGPCDLIISNPPYHRPGSGRINPNPQRAIARHEIKARLVDVLQTARRMLRTAGRFVTIFTADRTTDILSQMRIEQIEPKMIRMIHSNQDTDAGLILIEGAKGGRPGLKAGPPLFIYDENGEYTQEVQRMFEL